MLGLLQRRKEATEPVGGTSADISGSVSDSQLAIGEHIVQNNIAAGAIVNQIAAEQGPRPPRPRDKPLSVKPKEAPRLVGRDTELEAAGRALLSRQPVQFSGRSGTGKTALLRDLAHRDAGAFADGVVYYRSRNESLDDLLMRIFEFLYSYEERVKPTSAELGLYLKDTQALLLLDDVDLDREDLETLLLTLPRSVFVFGSPERSLWCDGTAIGLRGLRDDAALMLVEQHLGRPLAADEAADFIALCRALDGQPLPIIQAATQVREEHVSPRELIPAGTPAAGAREQLGTQITETLPPQAREALMLMAALGSAPLHVDHVAALIGSPDAAALLADLERRGLAKSHSPRYSLTDGAAGDPPDDVAAQWRRRLLSYFADHAEAFADQPERLRDDLEPIIASLRGGAAAGEWRAVLRLARAADPVASATKLWGAWATILGIALDAARQLSDEAQEAWALHQLGTRALCLGDADEASRHLRAALRIRERIGDRAAEITRHNLSQLPGAPPPPGRPPTAPVGPATPTWILPLCLAIVVMTGAAGVIATSVGGHDRNDRGGPAAEIASAEPERSAAAPGGRAADRAPRRMTPRQLPGPDVREPAEPAPVTPDPGVPEEPVDPIDPHDVTEPEVLPPPLPPNPRPPVPPPPPEPAPECSASAVDAISALIESEIEALQPLLRVDPAAALQAQVQVLQELLGDLGLACERAQITQLVRAVLGR